MEVGGVTWPIYFREYKELIVLSSCVLYPTMVHPIIINKQRRNIHKKTCFESKC